MDSYTMSRQQSIAYKRHQVMMKMVAPETNPRRQRQMMLLRNLMGFHRETRLHDLPGRLSKAALIREQRQQSLSQTLAQADPEIRLAMEATLDLPSFHPEAIQALTHLLSSLKHHVLAADLSPRESHSVLVVRTPEEPTQTQLMVGNPELELLWSLLNHWLPQRSKVRRQPMN